MTLQEEWEMQEAITRDCFAPEPLSQPSGVHKLNTRNRGVYNGFTAIAVTRLRQKKKDYIYSKDEEKAVKAYLSERLSNSGLAEDAGTPDELKYEGAGGMSLDVAEKEYVIDEKNLFDRSEYSCVLPLLPGESLISDCECEEETSATLAAWTVSVPVKVMASDELASESSRAYLQFAAPEPTKDHKPTRSRASMESKRKEPEAPPYDVRIALDGVLGWRDPEGEA